MVAERDDGRRVAERREVRVRVGRRRRRRRRGGGRRRGVVRRVRRQGRHRRLGEAGSIGKKY